MHKVIAMFEQIQETMQFVKEQHEWLVELQSVIAEKEQKYKILYNKLSYQLKKEIINQKELSHLEKENEDTWEDEIYVFMDSKEDGKQHNRIIGRNKYTNKHKEFLRKNANKQHSDYEDDHEAKDDEDEFQLHANSCKEPKRDTKLYSNTDRKRKSSQELTRDGANPSSSNTREKRYSCKVCHKKFEYKHVMQSHLRIHTGEKPFKCSYCDRAFTQLGPKVAHERIHTGEKPYKCNLCDMAFTCSSSRLVHLRTHTKIRPYNCSFCIKSFSTKNRLRSHFRTHTGEKPFKCVI